MTLGENIRAFRKKRGLSQRELGELVKPEKITQQQIAQYENSTRTPKVETIQRIAEALGVTVEQIAPTKYIAEMDFYSPTIEWAQKHLPDGYKVRSDDEDAFLWIEYPDGGVSKDINIRDLQEIIADANDYFKYKLEKIRRE